jgi:branched-chain amino acid transport system substrate-binding protein
MRIHHLIAIAVVLAFASTSSGASAQRAVSGEPYEVQCLLSLTGPFAFVGKKGATTLRAVETIVNSTGGIRGRPIHFVVNDIQSSPVVAVQVVTQVLAKKPPVIIGPEPGGAVLAIQPLTKSDVVLYVLAASIHPAAGSYTFANETSTEDLLFAGVRYLHKRGLHRIGMLATTDVTGNDQIEQVTNATRAAEMAGTTVVGVERYAISDISVASQLARLKAAGADVVFVGTTGTGFGTALHGLTDSGWDVPVMTNAGNIVREQMDQYKNFTPKQVYFTGARFMAHAIARPGPVKDAQKLFIDALRAEGVARPDFVTATVWDPAWVIVSGLRKFGTTMTAEQLHDYILSLHGFAGVNGILDFRDGRQRGLGLNATLIVRWDAAKDDWVPVSEPGGFPLRAMSAQAPP